MKYFRYVIHLIVAIAVSSVFAGAYEDFFQATRADNPGVVQALLARGFDPNAVDERGQPALLIALRDGSRQVGEILLAHPAIRIDQANQAGETPLMMAALKGHAGVARQLIERGAAVNRTGWGPLHYAASGPDASIVQLLVDHGAAIDARSPNGSTPLMMAAQYGPEDAVQMLLMRKAEASLRNDLGLSAADFARRGGREQLARQLDAMRR